MRVAVIGASGNLSSALLRMLADTPEIGSVVGVVRRPPVGTAATAAPAQSWVSVDIGRPGAERNLTETLRGVDAVVHLAWLLQPSRNGCSRRTYSAAATR